MGEKTLDLCLMLCSFSLCYSCVVIVLLNCFRKSLDLLLLNWLLIDKARTCLSEFASLGVCAPMKPPPILINVYMIYGMLCAGWDKRTFGEVFSKLSRGQHFLTVPWVFSCPRF